MDIMPLLKKLFFVQHVRMLNLSLKEFEKKVKAKNRGIKNYKSLCIDKLLSIFDKLEQVKKLKLSEI